MALLEAGLTTDTSIALSTTLAILYSKYNLEKLAPHLQLFKKKKLNIPKIIHVCMENRQWAGKLTSVSFAPFLSIFLTFF